MSRRGEPRRIYHRSRGRRSWGLFTWIQVIGMGGALLAIIGYIVWLFVFQPAAAAPSTTVWLPIVAR